jgi:TRAP-type C4-dicarboxylate transport system permease small subunit
MQRLARAYEGILNAFKIGAEIVVFLIFFLIVVEVFVRLVGLQPSSYTLGVVEYGLLWFTMLGAPWLVRMKGHVFVDSLVQLLPMIVQAVLARLVYVICIVCCLLFIYYSTDLAIDAFLSGEVDIRGEAQPLWLLLLPMPVSFAMIAFEFLRFLVGVDTMYTSRTEVRENV